MVWEPYVRTNDGYRVQSFDYASAQDNKEAVDAVPEAREEILQVAKGSLKQLACIEMHVIGFRVSKSYEPQDWAHLVGSNLDAHRAIKAGVDRFNSLANGEGVRMHFKFWF